jgi:hypothetical protein
MRVPSMSPRAVASVSFVAVAGLAITAATFAPAADIIRGTITSADGPVVATVTAVSSQDSASARTSWSRGDGTYSILFNPAGGPYRLSVTAKGFADTTFEVRQLPDPARPGLLVGNVTLRKPRPGEVSR